MMLPYKEILHIHLVEALCEVCEERERKREREREKIGKEEDDAPGPATHTMDNSSHLNVHHPPLLE